MSDDRITRLETTVERIDEAIRNIQESLAALVRLEERHAETRESLGRAFAAVKSVDDRVRAIETEMPMLKQVRQWVFSGVIGVLGIVGTAVVYMVVK